MKRETFIEVAVSVIAAGLFIAVLIGVGVLYTDTGTGSPVLTGAGPLALVGGIVFFVVVMAVAGYWLADNQIET